jgi:hypothetical protein
MAKRVACQFALRASDGERAQLETVGKILNDTLFIARLEVRSVAAACCCLLLVATGHVAVGQCVILAAFALVRRPGRWSWNSNPCP